MNRFTKETDRFKAKNANRKIYTICEYTEYEKTNFSTEPVEIIKSYKTSKGQAVNKIDNKNFEILDIVNIKVQKI
jgi:hypothetical protein